jgi:hypothetical protein
MFKNLSRKIYLLRTGDRNLGTEHELLKNNGLFDVYNNALDLRNGITSLQTARVSSVFVIGYSKDYSLYQGIVSHAMQKNIPLIVIAQPREIIDSHMAIFQQYVYFEMCNTPARLLTTIFNLSIITPT